MPESLDMHAQSHPLRSALSEEMHVRKLPRLVAPSRLVQVVTLLAEAEGDASRAHVAAMCAQAGVILPESARKYFVASIGMLTLVWERHTEFASYTLIAQPADDPGFCVAPFGTALAEWMSAMPGQVIRATQIALVPDEPTPDAIQRWFAADDLVVCDLNDGRARLWSDFRLHADGFGRLLLQDTGLVGDEPAQLVQRVQELGNYRNMALLGLPDAQRLAPEVTRLEQRLAALTAAVSERVSEDDVLLAELGFLSAELARLSAQTRYRMSATHAYAALSTDRLGALAVGTVRGYQNLHDFTERRLVPAMRTCDSFSRRLEDLSQRVAWTSSLLRTRVDTALGRQNRDLLDAMNRRARTQLRLQQTVEGLSVAAISYYVVGLVGYVAKAAHGMWHDFSPELVAGLAVPLVVGAVWLGLRRVHHAHGGEED